MGDYLKTLLDHKGANLSHKNSEKKVPLASGGARVWGARVWDVATSGNLIRVRTACQLQAVAMSVCLSS
jgi:hypothetical protein